MATPNLFAIRKSIMDVVVSKFPEMEWINQTPPNSVNLNFYKGGANAPTTGINYHADKEFLFNTKYVAFMNLLC